VALCLSFLPSKICDSCEWLVTGYGKVILSEIFLLILCQIFLSRAFFFYAIFGGIFGGFCMWLDSLILRCLCSVFFEGIMDRCLVHPCA
jgi:hypothetical protein